MADDADDIPMAFPKGDDVPTAEPMVQMQGTVKKWFGEKGFGFIVGDGGGADIFCHHSDIGGLSLVVGGRVSFDMGLTSEGKPKAISITGALGPAIPKGDGAAEWGGKGGAAFSPYGGGAPPPSAPQQHAAAPGQKTGVVKNWFGQKGFGFIADDAGPPEIFCHHSDIGGGSLIPGGKVTFDLGTTRDGQVKAINIAGAVGRRLRPDGTPYPECSGVVKNWFPEKGFGFIVSDTDGAEVFAHHSDIGGCSLTPGGRVTYDMGKTAEGKSKAVNIAGDIGPPGAGKGDGKGGMAGPPALVGPPAMIGPPGAAVIGPDGMLTVKGIDLGPAPASGGVCPAETEVFVIVPPTWVPPQKLGISVGGQTFEVDAPAGVQPGFKFPITI